MGGADAADVSVGDHSTRLVRSSSSRLARHRRYGGVRINWPAGSVGEQHRAKSQSDPPGRFALHRDVAERTANLTILLVLILVLGLSNLIRERGGFCPH